ncbi:MAG: hypothetical protein PHV30_11775 [Candidatus Margulisbacteria bacterium]|nr:hypothetical protein [Candidatus Margulisiibacteriota bacterium]
METKPVVQTGPKIIPNINTKNADQPVTPNVPSSSISAIPPQGTQGRPPIENITTKTSTKSNQTLGFTPQPGSMAEMQSAVQAVAEKVQDDKNKEEQIAESETAPPKAETEAIVTDEEELIRDMKKTIKNQTKEVSKRVNRSAFKFIFKKTDWLNKEHAADAEEFFTIKVPKVLAQELSKILNEALGLTEDK